MTIAASSGRGGDAPHAMGKGKGVTRKLASHAATLRYEALPPALIDVDALRVAGAVGPDQRGQPLTRRRPFDGQPGQQQRIGRTERQHAAIGSDAVRRAGQAQGGGCAHDGAPAA